MHVHYWLFLPKLAYGTNPEYRDFIFMCHASPCSESPKVCMIPIFMDIPLLSRCMNNKSNEFIIP